MTLKKDAMLAVSLAGIVLILAIGSTRGGEPSGSNRASIARQADHNPELLQIYIDFMSSKVQNPSEEAELRFAAARDAARKLYDSGKLGAPIDLMRASAIFASSTDPDELALAHDLSVEALSRGVKPARRIVLESEDRLLLSSGRPQRYGTQEFWMGRKLPGEPFPASSDLTPRDQTTLRTGNVLPANVGD